MASSWTRGRTGSLTNLKAALDAGCSSEALPRFVSDPAHEALDIKAWQGMLSLPNTALHDRAAKCCFAAKK